MFNYTCSHCTSYLSLFFWPISLSLPNYLSLSSSLSLFLSLSPPSLSLSISFSLIFSLPLYLSSSLSLFLLFLLSLSSSLPLSLSHFFLFTRKHSHCMSLQFLHCTLWAILCHYVSFPFYLYFSVSLSMFIPKGMLLIVK